MQSGKRIIGIGGVSRSGKSFLAEKLGDKIRESGKIVKLLDQDDFVFPEGKIPKIRDHIDWERPESIDFEKFKSAISDSSQNCDYVIAEGLMIFWYPGIFELFDYTIFIELDHEEFLSRKRTDLRWGREPDWYIHHIWEGYIKYGQFPHNQHPDITLDGKEMFDVDGIFQNLPKG